MKNYFCNQQIYRRKELEAEETSWVNAWNVKLKAVGGESFVEEYM